MVPPHILSWLGIALLSYLVGSIPTAYLAVRVLRHRDIRLLGDRNAGAANAARLLGRRLGFAVGTIDVAKGALVVLMAQNLDNSLSAPMLAGLAVVAGHNWPLFLLGRGGRGAAPAAGVLLALAPYAAIPLILPGLLVLYLTRSTTKALAFYYILTIFLSAWPVTYSLPVVGWPRGYPLPIAGYCLALPILVGLSHYLSLKLKPLAGAEGVKEPAPP